MYDRQIFYLSVGFIHVWLIMELVTYRPYLSLHRDNLPEVVLRDWESIIVQELTLMNDAVLSWVGLHNVIHYYVTIYAV